MGAHRYPAIAPRQRPVRLKGARQSVECDRTVTKSEMTGSPDIDSDENARAALRDAGLRATSARIAVLVALRQAERPMSHAELTELLGESRWDRTTVYRNLSDLADAGLARRTELGDRIWRFEHVGVHEHSHHHAHFVCTGCGTVACMPEVEITVPTVPNLPHAVRDHRIEVQVRGLCDDCDPVSPP